MWHFVKLSSGSERFDSGNWYFGTVLAVADQRRSTVAGREVLLYRQFSTRGGDVWPGLCDGEK